MYYNSTGAGGYKSYAKGKLTGTGLRKKESKYHALLRITWVAAGGYRECH